MPQTTFCGWDIGGAHLKYVSLDCHGVIVSARQIACPLWRGIAHLSEAIDTILKASSTNGVRHAITMTGELCDNFSSRADGVQEILSVVREKLDVRRTHVYAGEHGWCTLQAAAALDPHWIASANWRALAGFVALHYDGAIMLDIGSTTTDIIPISGRAVASLGADDASRLSHDELVYTGVVRTPLMALSGRVPFCGTWQGLAAEHFATTADIYRILEQLPPHADLHDAADGAEKTIEASVVRLSRMLGRDRIDDAIAHDVAKYFAYRQFDLIQRALMRVQSRLRGAAEVLVVAGSGAFLGRRIADFNALQNVEFSSLVCAPMVAASDISACAPAAAVAQLAYTQL